MATFDDYIGLEVRGFISLVEGERPIPVKGHFTKHLGETDEGLPLFEAELDDGNKYTVTGFSFEGELTAPGEFPHRILVPVSDTDDETVFEDVGGLDVQGVKLGYETHHAWAGIPVEEQEHVMVYDANTHEVVTPDQWVSVVRGMDPATDTNYVSVEPINDDYSLMFNRHTITTHGEVYHWDMVPGWFVPDPDAESGYREDPSLKED